MACTYTYNGIKYSEQEFVDLLSKGLLSDLLNSEAVTGIDLSKIPTETPKELYEIDRKYDPQIQQAQTTYSNELDADPNVVKLRDYIKKNGVENVLIGPELAEKLGMSPIDLFSAKEKLSQINSKNRTILSDLENKRQIEKDLALDIPVKAKNKEQLQPVLEILFNNTPEQAKEAAVVFDSVISRIAKLRKMSKEDVYNDISFDKTTLENIRKQNIDFLLQQENPLVRNNIEIGRDYDTDKVARERFDIGKLTKIGEGSDRDVYDLGDGNVLKIAKTARGLAQLDAESDYILSDNDIVPKVIEKGLNYNVMEKVEKADPYEYYVEQHNGKWYTVGTNEFAQLEDADNEKFIKAKSEKEAIEKKNELNNNPIRNLIIDLKKLKSNDILGTVDVLKKYGMEHADVIASYDFLISDLKNPENWGYKNGKPIHLDGGTFTDFSLFKDYRGKENFDDKDFREIHDRSEQLRRKFKDTDDNLMYQSFPRDAVSDVIKGFKLKPEPKAFGHAYITEGGKASPKLADSINEWLRTQGLDNQVKFVYEKTYGTVNVIPKTPHSILFQGGRESIRTAHELKTFDLGSLEGKKQTDERAEVVSNNIINHPHSPMITGGESFAHAYNRVTNYMDGVVKEGTDKTIVVTHNTVFGLIKLLNENNYWGGGKKDFLNDKAFREEYTTRDSTPADYFTIKTEDGREINVVRHGETEDNVAGNFRRAHTPLTESGVEMARALHPELGQTEEAHVSSLPRAIHTANLITNPDYIPVEDARGAIQLAQDSRAIIYAISNPNVSTPLHEVTHLYERYMPVDDQKIVLNWAGTPEWTRETSEKFANGFEKYLSEGKAPNNLLKQAFENLKNWLTDIYNGIIGSGIDMELSPEMRDVYARMLGEKFHEEAVEKVEDLQDKRLIPAKEGDFYHKKEISDAANNYEYVGLLKEGKIDKDQLQEVVSSVYGEQYARNYVNAAEFRKDHENYINSLDTNTWFDFEGVGNKAVLQIALQDGRLMNAIKMGYLPATDIVSIYEKRPELFSQYQLKEIKDTISSLVSGMNIESSLMDERIVHETTVNKEQIAPKDITPEQVEPQNKVEIDNTVPEQSSTKSITAEVEENKNRDVAIGEEVVFKGEKYSISDIDSDGMLSLTPLSGGRKEYAYPKMVEFTDKEPLRNVDNLYRVAEHMQKVFPDIPFEFVNDKVNWKGRIKDGKVQISTRNAGLDTPIHEFLHPFILAIKEGNKELYDNLKKDLDSAGGVYKRLVNNNENYKHLSESDRTDEAIVRYLAQNIKEIFNEDGSINEDVLAKKQKNIVDAIYDWFRRIYNLIFGVDKNVEFDRFRDNLIDSPLSNKYRIVEDNIPTETWKAQLLNLNSGKVIVLNKAAYNKEGVTSPAIFASLKDKLSASDYNELIRISDKALKTVGKSTKEFESFDRITYNKDTNKLKFFKAENDQASRTVETRGIEDLPNYIPKEHLKDVLGIIEQNQGNVSTYKIDPKLAEEGILAGYGSSAFNRTIGVNDINPNLTLKNLGDLVAAQNSIKFDLSSQSAAIEKSILYSFDTQEQIDGFRQKLETKLRTVENISSRIKGGSDVLRNDARMIRDVLHDFEETEDVSTYIRAAITGISEANRTFNDIRNRLKEGNLSEDDVNELNSKYYEARQQYGMFEDVDYLFDQHYDDLDKDTIKNYEDIVGRRTRMMRSGIANIGKQIVGEWLYPHYEEQFKQVVKRNPDFIDRKLSKEGFNELLRTADKDSSIASYWLGATIDSRDILNQTVAIAFSKKININQHEERDRERDVNDSYTKFLKEKGLSNNVKQVEDYFVNNYLRKARVWEQTGFDSIKKEPIYDYVERSAFHEKYFNDKYEDNLRKVSEKYKDVRTKAEHDAYMEAIANFHKENSVYKEPTYSNKTDEDGDRILLDPGGFIPSNKYLNPEFSKVSNDQFFKTITDLYKSSNDKYGEKKLRYGIIPQEGKEEGWIHSKIDSAKEALAGTKDVVEDKNLNKAQKAAQLLTKGANFILDAKGRPDNSLMNFDGTYYKEVKKDYATLKDDKLISKLVNETVIGMHRDSNMYDTMKTMQMNAENLKTLINGNASLGIEARKIVNSKNGETVFDKFMGRPKVEKDALRLNKQLTDAINDWMYGENSYEAKVKLGKKVQIDLNKVGNNLGYYTALNNMVGNFTGGVANLTMGNVVNLIEQSGNRYFSKRELGRSMKAYSANIPDFIADLNRPNKSLMTQLMIHYDMIQGEMRDKLGKRVVGGLTRKLLNRSSLFFTSNVGEHQIQAASGFAHMMAQKVPLKNGGEISLYDAWAKDDRGHAKLRDDVLWTKEDDAKFNMELHNLNRASQGNYSPQHKAIAQRYWWGRAALMFKKYVYENVRARYGAERVSLERGDVLTGYYRAFFSGMIKDIQNYKFDFAKAFLLNTKGIEGWNDRQKYAARKTVTDIYIMAGLFGAVKTLFNPDDKLSKEKAFALLQLNRTFSDMSMFSIQSLAEVDRQRQNPAAILRTVQNGAKIVQQILTDPNESYQTSGYNFQSGDSKLGHLITNSIPVMGTIKRNLNPESQLQFFNLTNKRIYN